MRIADRRFHRSQDFKVALRLLFQSVADKHQLEILTLATHDGLMVASTSEGHDGEYLAALGVSLARNVDGSRELLDEFLAEFRGSQNLHAETMRVGGQLVYLTSLGAPMPDLKDARTGVQRILAA